MDDFYPEFGFDDPWQVSPGFAVQIWLLAFREWTTFSLNSVLKLQSKIFGSQSLEFRVSSFKRNFHAPGQDFGPPGQDFGPQPSGPEMAPGCPKMNDFYRKFGFDAPGQDFGPQGKISAPSPAT